MFRCGMRRLFREVVFGFGLVIWFVGLCGNATGQVSIRCPDDCGEGAAVFQRFVNRLGMEDGILWDARESKVVPWFWHFSFQDLVTGQRFMIMTDGKYMIPNVLPVVPGRDLSGVDEDEAVREALRDQPAKQRVPVTIKPVNQIPLEQDGMFLGNIDPESWAEKLIQGQQGKGYILIVDALWDETVAHFLDEYRNFDPKWRSYQGYTIYFAPMFGFMGDALTSVVGKHYHALIRSGVKPVQTVYALSRISQAVKANPSRLREYGYQLVGPKKKASFDRHLLNLPSSSVFRMNKETIKLGIMSPRFYVIDGRVHYWRGDE